MPITFSAKWLKFTGRMNLMRRGTAALLPQPLWLSLVIGAVQLKSSGAGEMPHTCGFVPARENATG